ncbi:MAG: hypothetical protein IT173_04575, partial [Acidobacteria bacterium]|nr:hypothetical protein [Acidobacteriota bacterium]
MEVRNTGRYCRPILTGIFLTAFFAVSALDLTVHGQESPEPVLISEQGSTKVLAVNAEGWNGGVPSTGTAVIAQDSRVVVFVTNIDLLSDEGANAFRANGSDNRGKQYRLVIENIQPVRKRPWIFGVTLRVHDPNGYNGQPRMKGGLKIRITWRGNTTNQLRLTNGRVQMPDPDGLQPSPVPASPPSATANRFSTGGDRARFMEQAAFGPNSALDFRLRQVGFRRWIDEQFYKPYPTIPYSNFAQKPFD